MSTRNKNYSVFSVNRPILPDLKFKKCLVKLFALKQHQIHLRIGIKSSSYFGVFLVRTVAKFDD